MTTYEMGLSAEPGAAATYALATVVAPAQAAFTHSYRYRARTPIAPYASSYNAGAQTYGSAVSITLYTADPTGGIDTNLPGQVSDLRASGFEVTGVTGYGGGTQDGIALGLCLFHYDQSAGVTELALPSASPYTVPGTYTVTFRWMAFSVFDANGYLLAVHDCGANVTLTAASLVITAAESAHFPGTYPLMRWQG